MKIGNTNLKHGLMLAPMAGYTDTAMRQVCHNLGAEYSVTEMVSAKAVCFGDKKTHALARINAEEGPCAVQIFGSEPDVMARAAEVLSHGERDGVPPVAIDINMGCPVHKIFSNGEGSALMKNPDLIYKIVKSVADSIEIPCTVKLRAGISADARNAVECALAAEAGGAALITVHGRTRVEMYSGKADWEIIKNVKKSTHIPIVANGDVCSGDDAARMLAETGADGIMVGRAAIGNPFVFAQISATLNGEEYLAPTIEERVRVALLQLSLAIKENADKATYRVSMRSATDFDVSYVCARFGGGGHKRAAGCTVTASSIQEAEQKIISEIARLWKK